MPTDFDPEFSRTLLCRAVRALLNVGATVYLWGGAAAYFVYGFERHPQDFDFIVVPRCVFNDDLLRDVARDVYGSEGPRRYYYTITHRSSADHYRARTSDRRHIPIDIRAVDRLPGYVTVVPAPDGLCGGDTHRFFVYSPESIILSKYAGLVLRPTHSRFSYSKIPYDLRDFYGYVMRFGPQSREAYERLHKVKGSVNPYDVPSIFESVVEKYISMYDVDASEQEELRKVAKRLSTLFRNAI